MTTHALPAVAPGARPGGARRRPRGSLTSDRLGDHLDRLYRAALGLTGSPADAEDLVQDVCVRVLAKPRVVTGSDDLGYLLRVLRNTFISGRRTAARRPAVATAPEDLERFEAQAAAGTLSARSRPARCTRASPSCPSTSATRSSPSTCSASPTRRRPASLGGPTGTIMSRLFRARQALAA